MYASFAGARRAIAPGAVRMPALTPSKLVATRRLVIPLYVAVPVYFLVTPGHRVDAMIAVLAFALGLFAIRTGSMWLLPAEGIVANRRWGWYVFRYPLMGIPTVSLMAVGTAFGERVLLRVRPEGARTSGYVVLLCRMDDTAASLDAGFLTLLADMLDTHCPTAAPHVTRHLRAQADHVAAGLPAIDSPLIAVLDR